MSIDSINSIINFPHSVTPSAKQVDSTVSGVGKKKEVLAVLGHVNKETSNYDMANFGLEKSQMLGNVARSEALAQKFARGEPLTDEEMKFLEKNNPELLSQARNAKKQAQFIKEQMKSAGSKEQAQLIALSARGMALGMAKYSPAQAMVYLEAINKAISDYGKGNQEDSDSETVTGSISMQGFGTKNFASPPADAAAAPPMSAPTTAQVVVSAPSTEGTAK